MWLRSFTTVSIPLLFLLLSVEFMEAVQLHRHHHGHHHRHHHGIGGKKFRHAWHDVGKIFKGVEQFSKDVVRSAVDEHGTDNVLMPHERLTLTISGRLAEGVFKDQSKLTKYSLIALVSSKAVYKTKKKKLVRVLEQCPCASQDPVTQIRGSRDSEAIVMVDSRFNIVVISFRGTQTAKNVMEDASVLLTACQLGRGTSARTLPKIMCGKVHTGFQSAYHGISAELFGILTPFATTHSFLFTGHSLGGAIAQMAAYDFSHAFSLPASRVGCITFGQPRVGNAAWAEAYMTQVPRTIRYIESQPLKKGHLHMENTKGGPLHLVGKVIAEGVHEIVHAVEDNSFVHDKETCGVSSPHDCNNLIDPVAALPPKAFHYTHAGPAVMLDCTEGDINQCHKRRDYADSMLLFRDEDVDCNICRGCADRKP